MPCYLHGRTTGRCPAQLIVGEKKNAKETELLKRLHTDLSGYKQEVMLLQTSQPRQNLAEEVAAEEVVVEEERAKRPEKSCRMKVQRNQDASLEPRRGTCRTWFTC
jgi:hypothetical protein